MLLDPQMHELEERIMSDIIRRIRINGEITSSADWQIHRLYELGMSKREIKKIIKETLDLSPAEISHMYKQVLRSGYARSRELYKAKGTPWIPFDKNTGLQQLINAVSVQTAGTLQNITQSLGFATRVNGKLAYLPVADYYQKTLDAAMYDIASGAFDYNTVLKRTVREMTNSGLRTIDYASGWANRVEVAARRAIMTGMGQLTSKINEDNAKALETDWFEITWHSGFRPEHDWGGKWFRRPDLVRVCGLGSVTGLCGANCYHDYYPVIPGISVPLYTDEQLKAMNEAEQKPVEWKGKTYTKYEATQRQRALETTMRAQRQEMKLLKEGGADEDDLINLRARYRATSQEYVRFSEAAGLPQQRERVSIDGLGNIMQGKYTGGSGKESPVKVPPVGAKRGKPVQDAERSDLLEHPRMVLTSGAQSGIIMERRRESLSGNVFQQFGDVIGVGSDLLPDNAKRELLSCEVKLCGERTEIAVLFDMNGVELLRKPGIVGEVKFSEDELLKMPGCILTHNHPNSSPFSPEDISFLLHNGLSEIRATNKYGTYVLQRTADTVQDFPTRKEICNLFDDLFDKIGRQYQDTAAQNGNNILSYMRAIEEDTVQALSERFNLNFRSEVRQYE